MSEIELKFGVPEEAVVAIERTLRRRGGRARMISSHYWDSADGRLAKAGVSLRLRKSGGRWEQTVKAAGPSPAERVEETVPRPGRWDPQGPPPDPGLHAGTPAESLLRAALAQRDGDMSPLMPVFASVVKRLALDIDVDDARIEIAFDRGAIQAGERSLPLCEVEAELKHGDIAALVAVARAGIDAHGLWLSTSSKAARGDRLGAPDGPRAVKARPARLAEGASGAEIFRAVIRSCLDQVLANASVLADGELDDDVIHQLRVGIRRMRTAWRELAVWREALAPSWEAPAAELFRALGAYRDRQTVAASMQQQLAAAGSPDPVLRPPAAGDAIDPVALVRAKPFQHALLDVLAFLLAPAPAPAPASAPAGDGADSDGDAASPRPTAVIDAHLAKLHARLKRDARRYEQLDELERHGVRKRLKRLRYLCELVAPLYRSGRVDRFLAQLEPAQDELGHYMDLVVALRLAHDVIDAGDARAWFNVGWLKAQLPRAVGRCAKALRKVAAGRAFWR
jgi:inorganic triphosphatase YgiF